MHEGTAFSIIRVVKSRRYCGFLFAPWRGKQEMFREFWQTDVLKQPGDEDCN